MDFGKLISLFEQDRWDVVLEMTIDTAKNKRGRSRRNSLLA